MTHIGVDSGELDVVPIHVLGITDVDLTRTHDDALDITDTIGIWWDHEQTMEVNSSPADIFQHFGVLDGHWTLGGPVCRRPDALMLPDVRI